MPQLVICSRCNCCRALLMLCAAYHCEETIEICNLMARSQEASTGNKTHLLHPAVYIYVVISVTAVSKTIPEGCRRVRVIQTLIAQAGTRYKMMRVLVVAQDGRFAMYSSRSSLLLDVIQCPDFKHHRWLQQGPCHPTVRVPRPRPDLHRDIMVVVRRPQRLAQNLLYPTR